MNELCEEALEKLVVRDAAFAALERSLQVFCPFESTGMVRQEIRHGAFLTYILDPNRPHGFGTECLRALLTAAARSIPAGAGAVSPMDAYLMDYQGASVGQWRNIDILLRLPAANVVVAIELKIDASEHGRQLERYRKRVQAEWPDARHLFLFLTKRGDDPSDDNGEGWHSVELEAVIEELDRVTQRGAGTEAARGMLAAYIAMMRRVHLTDERMEKLARELWARHREALEFLADRRPDAMSEIADYLKARCKDTAELISKQTGLKVIPDDHSGSRILRFGVKDWDALPGLLTSVGWTSSKRLVLLELFMSGNAARMWLVLGPGDSAAREALHQRLVEGGASVSKPAKLAPQFKRMFSTTLQKVEYDGEADVPALATKIEEKFVDEAAKVLKAYDAALRGSVHAKFGKTG